MGLMPAHREVRKGNCHAMAAVQQVLEEEAFSDTRAGLIRMTKS